DRAQARLGPAEEDPEGAPPACAGRGREPRIQSWRDRGSPPRRGARPAAGAGAGSVPAPRTGRIRIPGDRGDHRRHAGCRSNPDLQGPFRPPGIAVERSTQRQEQGDGTMKEESFEVLSTFIDGETVDPGRLERALAQPGALEALVEFARLRAGIASDTSR